MKKVTVFWVIITLVFSCNISNKEVQKAPKEEITAASFFPVTSYVMGQIAEIKSNGINPLKVIIARKRTDSSWLKIEVLDSVFKEFLEPVIDTNNLLTYFSENKFADETLASYTLTYTPKPGLPDSFSLQKWDVYINPDNNKVKRIYMVKKLPAEKEIQLTWQSDKWCKTTCIAKDKAGNQFVEYEQIIQWNFN